MKSFLFLFFPKFRINSGLAGGDFISRDMEVVKAYKNDPLVDTSITLKLASEMIGAISNINRFIEKFKLPILIQDGSKDMLSKGIKQLDSSLKMKDKTIIVYEGLHHEVYNELEPDRKKVLNDLSKWLENHI